MAFRFSVVFSLLNTTTWNVRKSNENVWIKVARVVKLKLAFTEWLFYNLVILIKLYQIRYQNLDNALLFPRNQAICLKNWKLWRAPTTIKFKIFWWNFAQRFLLSNVYKRLFEIFFLFKPWVITKNVKKWVCTNQVIFYYCK